VSSGSDTIRMVRYGGKSAFPHSMMAQKISHIEKNLDTTSFTRRDALYMNFAYSFIYIFIPSRHPQQLMIPFCPKSNGKLAKLNLGVVNY
jgi:hypothetical protein